MNEGYPLPQEDRGKKSGTKSADFVVSTDQLHVEGGVIPTAYNDVKGEVLAGKTPKPEKAPISGEVNAPKVGGGLRE